MCLNVSVYSRRRRCSNYICILDLASGFKGFAGQYENLLSGGIWCACIRDLTVLCLFSFNRMLPWLRPLWCNLPEAACANTDDLLYPRPTKLEWRVYWIHLVRPSVCPSVRPSVCRRHGFRSVSQVCFGISISNFICMLMVVIGRSLSIFSDVTFKIAAWQPYWIFCVRTLTLVWLWISTPNFSGTVLMDMGRRLLIFSGVNFKMAAWQPYNFSLALNMNSKLQFPNTLEFQFQISCACLLWL